MLTDILLVLEVKMKIKYQLYLSDEVSIVGRINIRYLLHTEHCFILK